jgi:transposase
VSDIEIVARVERRRKWTVEEKAALIAEVETEGGKVNLVAQRHRISESQLYNRRSAWKAAAASVGSPGSVEFVSPGVSGEAGSAVPPMLPPPERPWPRHSGESRTGAIDIAVPNGSRVSVEAFVNEKALSLVLGIQA